MTEYADSVEPFVGPTVGGPSSPDTAYSDFKAGVVKAQQDSEAQLARRSETPFGQFLDMLGTGMMALPAGPLKAPSSRGAPSVPAPPRPPRPPAAPEAAAGELSDILASPSRRAFLKGAGATGVVAATGLPGAALEAVTKSPAAAPVWGPGELMKMHTESALRTAADDLGAPLRSPEVRKLAAEKLQRQVDYWKDYENVAQYKDHAKMYRDAVDLTKSAFPDLLHEYPPEPVEHPSVNEGHPEPHTRGEGAATYTPREEGVLSPNARVGRDFPPDEGFSSIGGGMRESSRFEHPAAETMPGEGGTTTLHEILGDQPLSRQGLAKSDAPLEARTSALIEGIDRAIEQGKKIRASINSYVGAAYKTLNAIHRRGTPDQLDKLGFSKSSIGGQEKDVKYREISDHLDQAISKTKLPSDALLYRGVGQTLADELAGLKPGQTITDKGFMSTSRREQVANGFAAGSGILRTLIEIKAPKGMPALDLGLLSKRNVEQEVVLPRNTELRYIGRTSRFNKNLTPVYQFEVVPSWESESSPKTTDSSTRTVRGSSSSTPTGGLPTSSVRRPRPSYRPSPPSESSPDGVREARRPGLPPTTSPELLERLDYTQTQVRRAEEALAKAQEKVSASVGRDFARPGDNPAYEEAVRIRDHAKTIREHAQKSLDGVLDEMLDRPDPNRGKFGDARESALFYPPERAPRPFQEDFPSGAQHEGGGIVTRDPEGRPLTAPFVAGRNVVGGADQAIPESRYDTVTARLLGKAAENVPPGKNPGSVGVTHFNTETGIPHSIELNSNLGPRARPLVYGHEIGHVIDQFAGEIPITGIEKELYRLFNSLNNPIRTRGGNDAHPWSPRMTPRKQGYAKDEAPRELMAEATRAYLQNPNYIKTEAPNVAARIRAYVNAHPWIKQTIQFNSLAGLGIIATEHDEQ